MTDSEANNTADSISELAANAANKTMRNMQRHAEIAQDLKANLEAYKLRLPVENRSDSFLAKLELRLNEMDALCAEALVAQSIQDLTDQSIKKVIKLASSLEINLISLLKIFGNSSGNSQKDKEKISPENNPPVQAE